MAYELYIRKLTRGLFPDMFPTAAHAFELVTESSVWLATGLTMSGGVMSDG